MRYYQTIQEALSEIQRDLSKAPQLLSTRVQQRVDQNLQGRETLGYSYAIEEGGIPTLPQDIIKVGIDFGFKAFRDPKMLDWLFNEINIRIRGSINELNELNHPALSTTVEGSWSAYTYGERLNGAMSSMVEALSTSPDSRRAFWPIFRPEDALRAAAPTRIPCSLGYQALIRKTREGDRLVFYYLQRSADFDTFFLSDVYLAHRFQRQLANELHMLPGQFIHTIISLHSFAVEGQEIY